MKWSNHSMRALTQVECLFVTVTYFIHKIIVLRFTRQKNAHGGCVNLKRLRKAHERVRGARPQMIVCFSPIHYDIAIWSRTIFVPRTHNDTLCRYFFKHKRRLNLHKYSLAFVWWYKFLSVCMKQLTSIAYACLSRRHRRVVWRFLARETRLSPPFPQGHRQPWNLVFAPA